MRGNCAVVLKVKAFPVKPDDQSRFKFIHFARKLVASS